MSGGKIAWKVGVGTGYSWFCLPFFCTPPSVRDSLFVFASFLPLFVGKTQNIAPVLRVTGVFSCIFFFTPPRAWLALHGRFTLASVWPKNAEKLRLFCRSRNNKLHFTWGCSILFLKQGEGHWDRIPFFFQWFWHYLKYFNSNHNLPSYSLFSKCFSWFFYLGVHRGTGVFS